MPAPFLLGGLGGLLGMLSGNVSAEVRDRIIDGNVGGIYGWTRNVSQSELNAVTA